MTFPTVPTFAATRITSANQADTTATRTFPSLTGLTKNAGDLLIAIIAVYESSASAGAVFSGWTGSFTEFADLGGTTANMSIGMAYKFSTGSETGNFAVTQAATIAGHASMLVLSIAGAHASTPPEAGAIAHGTTAAADPAALDPAGWAAEDTLWISVACTGETSLTGSYTGLGSTPPSNYGNLASNAVTGDAIGACDVGVGFRQLNASSEDAGAWTVGDLAQTRNSAVLVAVRPAAVAAATSPPGPHPITRMLPYLVR